MKNKIKPHYVDFSTAKLLKEKGFDNVQCTGYYFGTDDCIPITSNKQHKTQDKCLAPEQHQVVDWLLEKHGIWIDVRYMDDILNFGYTITTIKDNTEQYVLYKFNYPQQAYSAAIDYILLNNII